MSSLYIIEICYVCWLLCNICIHARDVHMCPDAALAHTHAPHPHTQHKCVLAWVRCKYIKDGRTRRKTKGRKTIWSLMAMKHNVPWRGKTWRQDCYFFHNERLASTQPYNPSGRNWQHPPTLTNAGDWGYTYLTSLQVQALWPDEDFCKWHIPHTF